MDNKPEPTNQPNPTESDPKGPKPIKELDAALSRASANNANPSQQRAIERRKQTWR